MAGLCNSFRHSLLMFLLLIGIASLLMSCSHREISSDTSTPPRILLVTVEKATESELLFMKNSLAADYHLEATNAWPLNSLDIYCFIYKLPPGADSGQVIARLQKDPRVESAQLVRQFEILVSPEKSSAAGIPNKYDDQHYPLQIGLKAMAADKAHTWATGKLVKVGVIDTGIDANHDDLTSVSYTRNFVGKETDKIFAENHGTAIAGVIAASANNSEGIVGVAPDAEVIGLRGCWQPEGTTRGLCNSLSLAQALDYANVNAITVINLSLQGPHDPILERLIDVAVEQNTVVIAAYQPSEHNFPASMQEVIAVTSDPGLIGNHSLSSILVAAPGNDILTTAPAGQYDLLDGSSLAAAHVTGIVALLREQQPELPLANIADLLVTSMHPEKVAESQGSAEAHGHTVNACRALGHLFGEKDFYSYCR